MARADHGTSRRGVVALLVVAGLAGLGTAVYLFLSPAGSPQGSATYRETVRQFYRGLASLEVGLLIEATTQFERAAQLAATEPAIPANLAVTHLRLGDDETAATYLETARVLAPENADIAVLAGLLDRFAGRFETAATHFRRAVNLDPDNLQARFALARELAQLGTDSDRLEAQQLLEEILERQPDNLAVLLERALMAATRTDTAALQDTVRRLEAASSGWPEAAQAQLETLAGASDAADGVSQQAATATARLRNVLVRLGAFRDSLAAVAVDAELVAEPFDRFLRLAAPTSTASPPDESLAFSIEPMSDSDTEAMSAVTILSSPIDDATAIVATDGRQVRRIDTQDVFSPFPGDSAGSQSSAHGMLAIDWNNDFQPDLALTGAGGVRLLVQTQDGTFADVTTTAAANGSEATVSGFGAWAADIEMDGDLDLVVGQTDGAPLVLRNNGDGTWLDVRPFTGLTGLRAFAWGDLDRDGDPDAALVDTGGRLHLFENQQAGQLTRWDSPDREVGLVALAMGDVNADGLLDVVALDAAGTMRRISRQGEGWASEGLAAWSGFPAGAAVGLYRVLLADLDNNGAIDLLASGPPGTRIWLGDDESSFQLSPAATDAEVFGVSDLDADGRLDLVGLQDGQPVRMLGRGDADYHWQVVRPRALQAAGDQRINSFGVGGEIEVRSGLLVQKQLLTGAPVHFGLGSREQVDVTRISWPNGVVQAEFDVGVDQDIEAEQRLKGSCPWLFANDGTGMQFVTDFLWRSPLGLRINAQDTAGIAQTEDWVRIRGDKLQPIDGEYDLRITAELWETHFFDHISMMVVDHPDGVDVFVDERFAPQPPTLALYATGPPRSVRQAWDDAGRDVTDLVDTQDGRYVATFERGAYQGITRDHYVEFELDSLDQLDQPNSAALEPAPRWLLAHGWVYPTDSSINVAIGQGRHPAPRGVALEAQTENGGWVTVHADLGFPSGKNKTMVIDLSQLNQVPWTSPGPSRRLRLRTNLEVYWDWLAFAAAPDAAAGDVPLRTRRLQPTVAELRYRGFSQTSDAGPRGPEVPRYDEIANTLPRWRDLIGYHTRFGDVRELLDEVDDRYVIVNAGDELRLRFRAPDPPPAGWRRDFVFIGDGWEKDGDYNTGFSKTVRPLPSHDEPDYSTAPGALEADPVYRRHPDDWQNYHTRFVTPDAFLRGLTRP
jgi:tetratricopeptide (TPR) repeat protein